MNRSTKQSKGVIKTTFMVMATVVVAGCQNRELEAISDSREAISADLRDPASAEFRNEKVQTLWSINGDRMTVYCGEVNGRNGFGGMAGFKPVHRVIAVSPNAPPHVTIGDVIIDNDMSTSYYMRCVREDTQRADGAVFAAYGGWWLGEATRRGLDVSEPKLSDTKVRWADE